MTVMPESPSSRCELGALLDSSSWSRTQTLVVVLAACAILCDGIDIQLMGLAIPAMARAWSLDRAVFASVLGLGLVGIGAGTFVGGLCGDRFGRRPILIAAIALIGFATVNIAFTTTVHEVLWLRFLVGVGIGSALPNATALIAEFTPQSRRTLAITVTIVCIPGGGFVAGLVAARVLTHFHWPLLFVLGGAFPLLLAVILFFTLPESPRYLLRRPERESQLRTMLVRMGLPLPADSVLYDSAEIESSSASSFTEILGVRQFRNTLTLWGAFSFTLAAVYVVFNWLPSLLSGLKLGLGVASSALAMCNLGGICGALLFAWWISLRGSRIPLLTAAAASGLSAVALLFVPIGPTFNFGPALMMLTLHGFFINALQTTLYALASHLYTSRVRATGVAAGLAMGRVGAITSAFAGAALLHHGKNSFFLCIALAMVVVFCCLTLMRGHIQAPA